jgi:uncharacterized membrane protein
MSLLDLTMTPNRSFDRRHAKWLIAGVAAVFVLGGLRLALLGAWPVLPFMAIDVALLSWAFRASYRSGRASERLRLTPARLTLDRIDPRGAERRIDLDPDDARARLETISDVENRLWLESRDKSVAVGTFLSPGERTEIHAVIRTGLVRRRLRQP